MSWRRFVLGFVIFVAAASVCLGLSLLYLYRHPATVKRLLEGALSSALDASVSIEDLRYAFDPLQVQAHNIHIRDGQLTPNLELRIATLSAACQLEGPVAQKTLVIDRLDLSGVWMQSEGNTVWQAIAPDTQTASAWNRAASCLFDILFFRHVRVASVALADTAVALRAGGMKVSLRQIEAEATPDVVQVAGDAQVHWISLNAEFKAPRFSARLHPVLAADRGVASGRLRVPEALYRTPNLYAAITHMEANVESTTGAERFVIGTGLLAFQEFASGWVSDGQLTAALSRIQAAWASDSWQLQGLWSGSVQTTLPRSAPEISVRLTGEELRLSGIEVRLKPVDLEASAAGMYPIFTIDHMDIRAPAVSLPVGESAVAINDLWVRIEKGRIDASQGTVSFPEISLASDTLRNLQVSLKADRRHIAVDVTGSDIGWDDFAARLGFLPPGWRFHGEDRLMAKAILRTEGDSSLTSTIDLSNLGFSNPSESCVAENVFVRTEINARAPHQQNTITLDASVSSTRGEFLWDRIYMDLSRHRLGASVALRYAAGERQLQVAEARLEIADLLALKSWGHLDRRNGQTAYDLTLQVPPVPIAPLFATLVAEPLRFEQSSLTKL